MIQAHELLVMLADAYDACKSEYMSCPWCGGYALGYDREDHFDGCKMVDLQKDKVFRDLLADRGWRNGVRYRERTAA